VDETLNGNGKVEEATQKKEEAENGLNESDPDERRIEFEAATAGALEESVRYIQLYPILKDTYGKIIDGEVRNRILKGAARSETIDVNEVARKLKIPETVPYEIKSNFIRLHANYHTHTADETAKIVNELAEKTLEKLGSDEAFKKWWDENDMTPAKFIITYSRLSRTTVYNLLEDKYKVQAVSQALQKYYANVNQKKLATQSGAGAQGGRQLGEEEKDWNGNRDAAQILHAAPATEDYVAESADTYTQSAQPAAGNTGATHTPQTQGGEEPKRKYVELDADIANALLATLPPNTPPDERAKLLGEMVREEVEPMHNAQRTRLQIEFPDEYEPYFATPYIERLAGRLIAKHRGHTISLEEAVKAMLNEYAIRLLEKYMENEDLPTLKDALEKLIIEHLINKGYKI